MDARLVPAGRRVEMPVSLRDIGKTILDLVGLAKGGSTFLGSSLARAWNGMTDSLSAPIATLEPVREIDPLVPARNATMISAFDSRWHLIRFSTRQVEEMFDYHVDSAEEINLIGSDSARAALPALRGAACGQADP